MLKRPSSLQGQLLALVLGLVSLVWLATAAMTWRDTRAELDELLDGHLAQAAALLVAQQMGEIEDGRGGDGRHDVDAPILHRYAPKVAFQVFHEGALVLRSANAPMQPMAAEDGPFKAGFRTATIDAQDWRVFAAHGAEQDVQVYVGEQVSSRASILWAVLRSIVWPTLLAMPLMALAVWWAVRRGVAPLRLLGRTLAARQPQALQPVTIAHVPAEMAPMIDALNGLFERIALLMESERRFTADAAHELRTPISAIRAQAQVAMGESDDAARRNALQSTLQACDLAARLVSQLLTLSRLETGDEPGRAVVDISSLAREVISVSAAAALTRQQNIGLDAPLPCQITGDTTLLTVLVRNLVDNAIRYTPNGGTIHVSVGLTGRLVRLRVEDSGPGMADEDIARLGERFFRVLGSGQGGSGLGWSIIQRVARTQGAAIRVRGSQQLGGLLVEVEWPVPA
jgi:two-component system sensor histidine kinase QseC